MDLSILLIGIPAALALMLLAGPILATLFLHGHFSAHDVLMTQRSLWAFAFGLPAFMLIKILVSAFYARQNVKTPVKVAALALVVNVVGNLLLIHSFRHAGLALSTSIAAYFNAICLAVLLVRKKIFRPQSQWFMYFIRLFLSCLVMLLVIFFCRAPIDIWITASLSYKVSHLLMLIALGLVTYWGSLILFGWRWRQ